MQGKGTVEKEVPINMEEVLERSRKEDEELVEKYVIQPDVKKNKVSKKGVYITLAIILLGIAFASGIWFGVFNFQSSSQDTVAINETAFPVIDTNDTNKTNSTNSTNATKVTKVVKVVKTTNDDSTSDNKKSSSSSNSKSNNKK